MAPTIHGFRFKPNDKELLRYLEGFVLEKPLSYTFDFITVEDLYGGKDPSEIFGAGGPSIRYFFTHLTRKCESGSRFLRGVGDGGTWKGQDAGQPIYDVKRTKTIMGFKKSLKYETKRARKESGADNECVVWLMKEYFLSNDYIRDKNVVHKDFVLCRIKKVSKKTSRNQYVQKIHEDDTLGVYEWPEKEAVISPPPSEISTLTLEGTGSTIDGFDELTCECDNSGDATTRNQYSTHNVHEDDMLIKVYGCPINPILINNEHVPNNNEDDVQGDNMGEMIEGDGTTYDMDDEVSRLLMSEVPEDFTLDNIFCV